MEELPRHTLVAVVFIPRDDKILLVKQNYGRRYWSLPGGVVEKAESVDQAAIREVKEETGLDIQIIRVTGLYSVPGESALAIALEGEVIGGVLEPGHEISECSYFATDQLPSPIRERLRQRVEDFQNHSPHAFIRTQ